MDKKELRIIAAENRGAIDPSLRASKSLKIIQTLESLDEFKRAKNILAYYGHRTEVEMHEALKNWKQEKHLFLPALHGESLKALPMTKLETNKFGIPEPVEGDEPETLDLILVPGLAFDREGNRLGMGMGYYDRFLSTQKDVFKIGLAYSEQILASVPKDSYDETVDMIITDQEVIRLK